MSESFWAGFRNYETHYPSEFAIVMAESPSETRAYLKGLPPAWEKLCPTYYSSTSQLGAVDSYAEAANITTLLLPDH